MKVSKIEYKRVTLESMKEAADDIVLRIKSASCVQDVIDAREDYITLTKKFMTALALSSMRYTINTVDEFYLKEKDYYDEITPSVQNLQREYSLAMLECPFRDKIESRLTPLLFESYEMDRDSMNPEIIGDMVEENRLVTEYSQLMAGMTFDFKGDKIPLSMLRKYMQDDEREVRSEAYEVLGTTLSENSQALDSLFDKLVHVRDRMAKKLGYDNFIALGYCRFKRISFDRSMVEKFRAAVLKHIVPAVARIKTENARRMGIDQFMLYDNDVNLPGGNPKPILDRDGILTAAGDMYNAMSEDTAKFFNMMMENEAFDVDSRKNKWGGGYCTNFPDYKQPFILANFNGTAADVDVVTHEAGHAFADYMTADNRFIHDLPYGAEIAETHSMSMEFFAWKYIERFFGENTQKYKFCHLLDALTFIPYGTIVDYFQHVVYEKPDMTPAQRDELWNSLEAQFRPYLSTEGMTYLSKGTRWQYQMHIYETPFYYIDYCLAQFAAFQFLLASQEDYDGALKGYMQLVSRGGEKKFADLLMEAGMSSPFDEHTISLVAVEIENLIKKLTL